MTRGNTARSSPRFSSVRRPDYNEKLRTPQKQASRSAPSTPKRPSPKNNHNACSPKKQQRLESINLFGTGMLGVHKKLWMDDVPASLPHREDELNKIYDFCTSFIENDDEENRSLYLGGVPGTGKTSCVLQTIKSLEEEGFDFKFIPLNGGQMLKPEELYVQFYKAASGSTARISASNARSKLISMFSVRESKRKPIILLVDELDFLVNKKQTVIYDVFDMVSKRESRLAVISITNTFDFTSRVLDQRVQSRIGTNMIHFQPYDWQQIGEILDSRLSDCGRYIHKDVIKLASRKVANMSGDIRKALDILRRSVDIAVDRDSKMLLVEHLDAALKESRDTYRMCLMRSLSEHEIRFFRAVYDDLMRCGLQETKIHYPFRLYGRKCVEDGLKPLSIWEIMRFAQDGVSRGYFNLSKAPGTFNRKISLGFAPFEAKFCLDNIEKK